MKSLKQHLMLPKICVSTVINKRVIDWKHLSTVKARGKYNVETVTLDNWLYVWRQEMFHVGVARQNRVRTLSRERPLQEQEHTCTPVGG